MPALIKYFSGMRSVDSFLDKLKMRKMFLARIPSHKLLCYFLMLSVRARFMYYVCGHTQLLHLYDSFTFHVVRKGIYIYVDYLHL